MQRASEACLPPIGSPPNLIGREFIEQETGTTISFFEWVVMAFPIVLIMFVLLCIILILLNRPETRQISGAEEFIAEERDKLGRFSRGNVTSCSSSDSPCSSGYCRA